MLYERVECSYVVLTHELIWKKVSRNCCVGWCYCDGHTERIIFISEKWICLCLSACHRITLIKVNILPLPVVSVWFWFESNLISNNHINPCSTLWYLALLFRFLPWSKIEDLLWIAGEAKWLLFLMLLATEILC